MIRSPKFDRVRQSSSCSDLMRRVQLRAVGPTALTRSAGGHLIQLSFKPADGATQVGALPEDRPQQVALGFQSPEDCIDRNSLRAQTSSHFAPLERRRNQCTPGRPQRIRCCGGLADRVAHIVKVDLPRRFLIRAASYGLNFRGQEAGECLLARPSPPQDPLCGRDFPTAQGRRRMGARNGAQYRLHWIFRCGTFARLGSNRG